MSSPPPPCISSDIPRLRFNFPTPLPIGSTLLLLSNNSSSEKREGDTDTAKKSAGMSTRFINNSRFFSISVSISIDVTSEKCEAWALRNIQRATISLPLLHMGTAGRIHFHKRISPCEFLSHTNITDAYRNISFGNIRSLENNFFLDNSYHL